ncbi:MAG: hypothetical protein JNL67_05800 [Planctomycetaceae bacterium]|nr:hypothetical protein [Planctomycetaceae bacterium]
MLNEQDPWTELAELEMAEMSEFEASDRFSNRRQRSRSSQDGLERRQFGSNYSELSPAGAELGRAIDSYKVANHRRYVTYDEILKVLMGLGYHRSNPSHVPPLPATNSAFPTTSPSMQD